MTTEAERSDASMSQGRLIFVNNQQKLDKIRVFKETWPYQYFDFRLLGFENLEKILFFS